MKVNIGIFRTLPTSKMERFTKKPSTIFAKRSISDVWQDSVYASKYLPALRKQLDSI